MKHAFLLCLVLAAAPLSGLAQAPSRTPLTGKLLITGSSTMAPLVEELGKRFRAQHPGVLITVTAGGSARGVADALAGKADIGMVARELKLDRTEQTLFAIPIARDGVTFVVHKDNPVQALTRAQALAVFTGKLTNWRELGGRPAPIEVVTRMPGGGVMEIVPHYLGIAPEAIKAAHVIGENAEVVRFVAANRNAIAFFSVGAADDAAQLGLPLKPITLDGKVPGSGSVRDGTWPLARPLNLLTRRVPAGAARAFIEFALSPAAREVVLEYDFVPYQN